MNTILMLLSAVVAIMAVLGLRQFALATRNGTHSARVRWSLLVMSVSALIWMALSALKAANGPTTLNDALELVAVGAFVGAAINIVLAWQKQGREHR